MNPPTIAFLGLFGSPNLGNEATLAAFLHHVRQRVPGARFFCVAPRQSRIEQVHSIALRPIDPWPVAQHFWRVRSPLWHRRVVDAAQRVSEPLRARRARDQLAQADALVIPGTGLIDDFGQRPLDMPSHLDRWTAGAAARGIPVAFLSIGVSTVVHPESRRRFGRSLERAAQIGCRDAVSADNARALGCRVPIDVVPDMAFSLPPAALPRTRATPAGAPPVVGVGVMGYFGWNVDAAQGQSIYERYLDRLCRLVDQLRARGHAVRLLTGDTRADDATIERVRERCTAGSAPLLTAPIADFNDVLREIALTDVVVASRYHNLLLSLLLRKPVVSLGYADKNDALMADFGLQAYAHDIERFDPDTVAQQIPGLLAGAGPGGIELDERLDDCRRRLDRQYDRFCARWRA